MTRLSVATILLALFLAGCNACNSKSSTPAVAYKTFGEPAAQKQAPEVSVKTVLASASEYEGKFVRVSGTVAKVCDKKGCWLTLGDGADTQTMFVKFTCPIDNGRLIPAEAVGKQAIVEGTVTIKTISEAEARHYKEDAGASAEEIAKIVGPQKQITVAAPSAQIAGL